MLWMLQAFGYNHFDMSSILEMALKHKRWDLVEWISINIDAKMFDIKLVIQSVTKYSKSSKLSWLLENVDHKLLDLQSMMTSAYTFDNISLVRSMIDRFGIEMFQSEHIMQFAIRNLRNGSSDIVKLCLKNSLNIGEYNMIELFNIACRYNIIELIEWLLVHHDHVHFHFNSAITETLRWGSYKTLKLLLIKLDHIFLDMESIIQSLCQRREFDIVMWMLDTFHPHLADIRSVMSMACQYGELHLVQCIIRQYGIRMFDIESIFDDACKNESSSLLEWLYQNFENSHIYNLNNFPNYSFRNIIFLIENRKINSSDYNTIFNHLCQNLNSEIYMEFLTCLLDTMDHRLFDLKLVFNHVCRYGTTDFVKWMMNAFDQTLFDFQSVTLDAAKNNNFEIVTFLLKKKAFKKPNFDVKSVFLEACHHSNVQLANWLLDNFEYRTLSVSEGISRSCSKDGCTKFIMNLIDRCKHNLIDFNIVIQAACRGNLSFTFIKRLMEFADTSKVDGTFVMHRACNSSHPDWDFVKFMFTTYDYKIFDMKLIFNSACRAGSPKIVKWLLDHYGRDVFDLKSGFNEACCKRMLDIVKLLIESVGIENFDLQSAMQPLVEPAIYDLSEYDEIFEYLLNTIQPSVSDLQSVMDKMCSTGNTVFVKWLIESFDCSKLDLNSTISKIFDEKPDCLKVLELLLQSFDRERFDMISIIFRANQNRYREFVKKTVDHSFFDRKTVLLEICKEGDLDTVTYLIETCHYEDLVDEAFILNAFRNGSSDIVKWLLHKRKGEIIDTKTAMSNACIGGHTQLVQYLLVKYNVKHFDLRSAINAASYYGRTEVVQLFLQVFHYETFDMDSVIYHARNSGHIGLVKWLLGVYDHEIFNIESGFLEDVKNEMAKCEISMNDFDDYFDTDF
jgi:F0F1-type ATP synthase delta subunit